MKLFDLESWFQIVRYHPDSFSQTVISIGNKRFMCLGSFQIFSDLFRSSEAFQIFSEALARFARSRINLLQYILSSALPRRLFLSLRNWLALYTPTYKVTSLVHRTLLRSQSPRPPPPPQQCFSEFCWYIWNHVICTDKHWRTGGGGGGLGGTMAYFQFHTSLPI